MRILIENRQKIVSIYRRHQTVADIILKFIFGLYIFTGLSGLANGKMSSIKVIGISFFFSVMCSIVPISLIYLFIILAVGLYLFNVSVEAAILTMMVLAIVYLFFVRIFPKVSLIIIAFFALSKLGLHYAVPLFAGVFAGIGSIAPIAIAVFLYSLTPIIPMMIEIAPKETFTPLGMADTLVDIYIKASEFIFNNQSAMLSIFILVCAFIVVYAFNQSSIDNNREMGIGLGGCAIILGYIIAVILKKVELNLISMILGTVISMLVVVIASYFDMVLDYQKSERVKFQDDENYYFVKVVPKVLFEGSRQESKLSNKNYDEDYDEDYYYDDDNYDD